MQGKLNGKVALITGAAQGIGAGCAARLAAEGAAVVIADLSEEGGRATAEAIDAAGGKASFIALDVTDESAWAAAIAQVRAEHGALHVLLNNAGIGRPAPLTEMSQQTFRLHFAINVEGMFLGMKHAIPLITASGGGSIINLASTASKKVYATMSAYCASKAALAHLTKVAALERAEPQRHPRQLDPPRRHRDPGLGPPGLARRRRRQPRARPRRDDRPDRAAGLQGRPGRHRPRRAVSGQRGQPLRHRQRTGGGRRPGAAVSRRRDAAGVFLIDSTIQPRSSL